MTLTELAQRIRSASPELRVNSTRPDPSGTQAAREWRSVSKYPLFPGNGRTHVSLDFGVRQAGSKMPTSDWISNRVKERRQQ